MPKAHPSPSWFGLCLAVAVIAGMALACGGSTSVPPVPTSAGTVALPTVPEAAVPTEAVAQTESPPPSPTPEPPTAEPPPYLEPVVLAEVTGTGEAVSDNYNWPDCQKAVFEWSVNTGSYGMASLILHLNKVGSDNVESIVNEAVMDNPSDRLSGSSLYPLTAGEYYFSSENTDEAWTVRVVCKDGEKPVGEGFDIAAAGNIVTDNYTLRACQKSVFVWTAEAGTYGMASLILHLCGRDCEGLINEAQMDVPDGIKGEALQAVDGGDYYLVAMNTGGNKWTVKWECRD